MMSGRFRTITLLLWAGYLLEALAFASLYSWFQIILIGLGHTRAEAVMALSYYGITHVIMVVIIAMVLDKIGHLAGVALTCIAATALVVMATGWGASPALTVAAVASLAAGVATNSVFNGTVGTFYPTEIRSRSIALATAWLRMGQISGPPLTGLLMNFLGYQRILILLAIVYIIIMMICLCISKVVRESRKMVPKYD